MLLICLYFQMPRKYQRVLNHGTPENILQRAMEQVKGGCSIRAAAKDFTIARMTLKKYITKQNGENHQLDFGYKNCQRKNMIFSEEMETELPTYIKQLAEQFHGISRNKCRALIVEYGIKNNVNVPDCWKENKMTGEHSGISFKERNSLAIITPEATSLARASAFNRLTVGRFYEILAMLWI